MPRWPVTLSKKRFEEKIFKHCFDSEEGSVIKVGHLFNIIRELQCRHPRCSNEARYDSGFCGIHDIEFNDGKGKRITHPET